MRAVMRTILVWRGRRIMTRAVERRHGTRGGPVAVPGSDVAARVDNRAAPARELLARDMMPRIAELAIPSLDRTHMIKPHTLLTRLAAIPVLLLLALLLPSGPVEAAADRPSIVVILVDDLRFDDLGCNGHPFSRTPNVGPARGRGHQLRRTRSRRRRCARRRGRASSPGCTPTPTGSPTTPTGRPRRTSWTRSPAACTTPGTARRTSASGTWATTTRRGRASTGGCA